MAIPLPTAEEEYDCVKCGACCATNWEDRHYVYLSDGDVERIPEAEREGLVSYIDGDDAMPALLTKYNKQNQLVCAALKGTVGRSVGCSIYECRPFICEQFAPGSDECDYARRELLGISLR